MHRILIAAGLTATASPVFAASGSFFSLRNTDFVVVLAFILFIAVLLYFKVPALLTGILDKRAEGVKAEIDEARALRDEAQSLLASYERRQAEVKDQADRIVAQAKEDAAAAAKVAKEDIRNTIARRVQAAEDRIASAESKAVREIRDQAIVNAVGVAKDIITAQIDDAQNNKLFAAALDDVNKRLH